MLLLGESESEYLRRQNMNSKLGEKQKKGHHVRRCPNFQGLYFRKCPRAG